MPALKAFYEKYANLRKKFEILALHESSSVKSFKELDREMASLERELWKGKLPFPILIDKQGQTVKRYGIIAFPTAVLIDPQGRIVKGGHGDTILALIKEKLGVKEEKALKL